VSQLVGVEALKTKEVTRTHRLLIDHLKTIRTIPGLERCIFVLSFESNLA